MIKIGQIGIGHNHGEAKMLAVRKFPELFEVVGFAEENEEWIKRRGNLKSYEGLKRYSVDELIEKCDALLIETDVWNLTETAQKCIDAGKHIHMDKPASGTLEEYKKLLEAAKENPFTYEHEFAVQEVLDKIVGGVGFNGKNID
ncbi:MAG: Gfo/Idh/MocA family oxidoreductase [Clostridia bacterium]|nr:Gfo/Idh/MocA family oxidoreductase [Clostridia bacterium]